MTRKGAVDRFSKYMIATFSLTPMERIKKKESISCQCEINLARKVQFDACVSGCRRTSRSTVARSNSEGAKRAKNSGLKRWRKVDGGGRMQGEGGRQGRSHEKGPSRGHGGRPVDRSSG